MMNYCSDFECRHKRDFNKSCNEHPDKCIGRKCGYYELCTECESYPACIHNIFDREPDY
ncbi:hypothetical protein M2146_001027 [Lachnospiraceae bacterium PF1-22]